MQPSASERPLGELFTELARETVLLVRQELELAKVESLSTAKRAGRSLGVVVGGVFALGAGGLVLVAAAILAMAMVMPLWLACLIAGGLLSGMGALLAASGVAALRRLDPLPRQTIETLKENRQWLSEQTTR